MAGALGHVKPPDFEHVLKYPIGAAQPSSPEPMCLAGNWYTDFDAPKRAKNGSWHLPSAKEIRGSVRGGHNTSLAQMGALKTLPLAWWYFYNQGPEGACEGVGHAQRESLRRGGTYDGFWLYNQARKLEGTFPDGEGTTSRTICQVLKAQGLRVQTGKELSHDESIDGPVDPKLGISAYRWATTAEEVCNVLGRPNAYAVPLINQWGPPYPQVVWLPVDMLDRILHEEGEADVITDR